MHPIEQTPCRIMSCGCCCTAVLLWMPRLFRALQGQKLRYCCLNSFTLSLLRMGSCTYSFGFLCTCIVGSYCSVMMMVDMTASVDQGRQSTWRHYSPGMLFLRTRSSRDTPPAY